MTGIVHTLAAILLISLAVQNVSGGCIILTKAYVKKLLVIILICHFEIAMQICIIIT